MFEHLDVACGGAVASRNGERGMRPRGREVEKRVGSALPVTPESGNFRRKSGLVRNQKKKVPIVPWTAVDSMFTLVSCVQFSSTLMSPAE